jgi:hypothetical protein
MVVAEVMATSAQHEEAASFTSGAANQLTEIFWHVILQSVGLKRKVIHMIIYMDYPYCSKPLVQWRS